jgi:hypothetical protein
LILKDAEEAQVRHVGGQDQAGELIETEAQ